MGWITLLFAVLLLALLALPTLAGKIAPGLVEKRFAKDYAGRVHIGELNLGWFGRQTIRDVQLFDPEDQLVADVDLELPSLAALARGLGRRIGVVVVDARAELVADDAGLSNLQRALAPRSVAATPPESEPAPQAGEGMRELPEVDLLVRVSNLSWSDARTRSAGAPFQLADLNLHVQTQAGKPLELLVDGEALSETPSELHLEARVFDLVGAGTETPPRIELDARVDELPTALIDALADQGGLLVELMGPSIGLRANGAGSTQAGTLGLELLSAGMQLKFSGELAAGLLRSTAPLELSASLPAPLIERFTAGKLPEGMHLRSVATNGPVRLRIEGLAIALEALLAAETPAARSSVLADSAAEVHLALDDIGLDLDGEPIDLSGIGIDLALRPETPARVHLVADVVASPPGKLNWNIEVDEPFAMLASDEAPLPKVRIKGSAGSLPTATIDRLAKQDGLLLDALGDRMGLELDASWPSSPDEPLRATLSSPHASVEFQGIVQDGVLVATGEQGMAAKLPLTPLVSSRIVGNLLPVLLNVSKPSGAAPIGLRVSDFRLPLGGDLTQLSANIRLEMGEIGYELLPKMQGYLASLDGHAAGPRTTKLDPFSLRIADGILRYDALPLRIDGRDIPILGSFNLASRTFDLSTAVPLEQLRGDVGQALEKARRYLEPGLKVPLQIQGTWANPRVSIAPDFMETVVEKAVEGAARKGLGDLLNKALGGG